MKHLLLLISFFAIQSMQSQTPEPAKHRVVIQMSTADVEEQKGLVNNLESLKKGWHAAIVIEVVAHGPGISFLLKEKTPFADEIQKFIREGVVFVACENTMAKKNITKAQLLDGVGTVPMGLAEIILKQEQGWSYLKAGF